MNNPVSILLNVLQNPRLPESRAIRRGVFYEGASVPKDRLDSAELSVIETPGSDAFVRAATEKGAMLYTKNGKTFLRREQGKAIPVSNRATHLSPDGAFVFSLTYDKTLSPDPNRQDSVIRAHFGDEIAKKERLLSLPDCQIVDLPACPDNQTLLLALEPLPNGDSLTVSGLYRWTRGTPGLRPIQTGPNSHFADMTLNANGSMLAFRDPVDEEIKTLDLKSGKISQVSNFDQESQMRGFSAAGPIKEMHHSRPCFSPDGDRVIYTRNDLRQGYGSFNQGQVLVADPNGRHLAALTSYRAQNPAVSVLTQGTV